MLSKSRFQALLRLTRKKQRIETGVVLVEGWRWLEEVLDLPEDPVCVLALTGAARSAAEDAMLARARARAAEFHEVTETQMARLTDSVHAPGVAALLRWRPAAERDVIHRLPGSGPSLLIALDAIGDPGNAGAIIRTADWFGAHAVFLGPGSVDPTNPKCARATMGSLFHLPLAVTDSLPSALGRLRAAGYSSVGASLGGDDMHGFAWPERCVLVVGSEANGIQPEVVACLERRVRIPGFGRAESLNASVATAILTADWRQVVHAASGP